VNESVSSFAEAGGDTEAGTENVLDVACWKGVSRELNRGVGMRGRKIRVSYVALIGVGIGMRGRMGRERQVGHEIADMPRTKHVLTGRT
jgi:hypothetical protein